MNRLGKTIRILRQAKDLKLNELAKVSGVSVPYLSLVENGERQPSLDVLHRLAKALNVPIDALMTMGMEEAYSSQNGVARELAETVDRLMEIEKKLRRLLKSGDTDAAKGSQARRRRRRDEPKPR